MSEATLRVKDCMSTDVRMIDSFRASGRRHPASSPDRARPRQATGQHRGAQRLGTDADPGVITGALNGISRRELPRDAAPV